MSGFATALAGAITAIGVGAVAMARSWPAPTNRTPTPDGLLRPVEALDQVEARCPVEGRTTLQVRLRLGGLLCTECRNPAGGA